MSETGNIQNSTLGNSSTLPPASSTEHDFVSRLENFVLKMNGLLDNSSPKDRLGRVVKDLNTVLSYTNVPPPPPSVEEKPVTALPDPAPTTESSPQPSLNEELPVETLPSPVPTTEGSPQPSLNEKLPPEAVAVPLPTDEALSQSALNEELQAETPANTVPENSANQPQNSLIQPSEQSAGDTPPAPTNEQREFYTDVVDANKNNIFDQEDVASVIYDKEIISTELANRPERIILMGEDHEDQPLDTIEATIQKIAPKGKPVIYTVELSSEYLSANGPDLIGRLNKGEITPEEFESRFVRQMQTAYGQNVAVDPVEVANTIVRMHNAGAKIVPIDDGSKAVLDYAEANSIKDIGSITNINRDEIMANQIVKLYKENPEATIISSLGGAHAQANANIQNAFGSSDAENPVGTRLIEALGRDEIFSVYNYQTKSNKDYEYYDMVEDVYLRKDKYEPDLPYDTFDMYVPANDS